MKITSGRFSGISLKTPEGIKVRPTLSKTRQALFNILRPYTADSVCVDLFAGTGALGFEAISNGAAKCYFIDNAQAKLIKMNADKLKLKEGETEVLSREWDAGLSQLKNRDVKADIVFADPPYDMGFVKKLLNSQDLSDILNDSAVFACESSRDESSEEYPPHFKIIRQKEYGQAVITIYMKGEKNG